MHIQKSKLLSHQRIKITGSKSESNRLLLLQALYPELSIKNCSNSDDSEVMTKALVSNESVIDIHHAGTAMRFLTAYFAIQENKTTVLTGSPRMKERPIAILVEALRSLGAEIEYIESHGFPPLKIIGKRLHKSKVILNADISSQYISALLLIASKLEQGLELQLEGKITSVPYIKMTLSLLNDVGIESSFISNIIKVKPKTSRIEQQTLVVESDWSSASYFYSLIALSQFKTEITISAYKKESLQGDAVLAKIYKSFGVETYYDADSIRLVKENDPDYRDLNFHLNDAPDIAQTIAVTAFGLGRACSLTGLQTLKIKETDRLLALKTELGKLGANVDITEDTLNLAASTHIKNGVAIATYNDHRMAMAFAPLGLKTDIIIENPEVVSKSYPDFWKDLESIGFEIIRK